MVPQFLGWLDRDANADGKFLKISTNSSSIVLTGNHLIFRLSADVGLESVFADQLEEGAFLSFGGWQLVSLLIG